MNIGQCSICLSGFTISQMGVLPCMHTFHSKCVERAVSLRGKCALCRRNVTMEQIVRPVVGPQQGMSVKNLPNEARKMALDFYERIANNRPGERMDQKQQEQLEICLNALISTIEDCELEREENWERLKRFVKFASIAAVGAVLVFLSVLYWPVIAPLAGRVVRSIWELISSLVDLVKAYLPEIIGGTLALTILMDPMCRSLGGETQQRE